MSVELAGQRLVIIGGSSGIGLALAQQALVADAEVVIGGRSAERLAAASALAKGAETVQVDATDEAAMAALFATLAPFDHLTVLVPSASARAVSAGFAPFLDMDPVLFANVFRNRFWTQCWGARYGAPRMRPGGSIVFMSNSQPRKPIPTYSPSCAAAGAIEALMRILAVELAPVRVNVIAPGFIETPGTEDIPPERRSKWDRIAQAQPVQRLGLPDEIASGMLFLMANRFTTGAVLDIDGGYRFT